MICRFACLTLFFGVAGASLHSATAQAQVTPVQGATAVPQDSAAGQLSETQWLRQRVERLEAELATGEHCARTKAVPSHGAADGMKAAHKSSMAGKKMSPMGMEPMEMDDKMGEGMRMGGMKDARKGKPMDKMAPDSMAPATDPSASAPAMGHM